MTAEFYNDPEPWTPPRNCYPTNDDAVRYYLSHTKHTDITSKNLKRDLANFVIKIWKDGDGCPKTTKAVIAQFDKLFSTYQRYKKEGREKKSHKKKISDEPPKQPTRKSRRLCEDEVNDNEEAISADNASASCSVQENDNTPTTLPQIRQSKRKLDTEHVFKQEWIADYGCKTFDIVSHDRIKRLAEDKESTETFDSEYYDDQVDPQKRTKVIELMKVTKEYSEMQKVKKKSLTRKAARRLSALGHATLTTFDVEEEDRFETTCSDDDQEMAVDSLPVRSSISEENIALSVVTRSRSSIREKVCSHVTISTQTDSSTIIDSFSSFPRISTRKATNSKLCHPAYLQAGLLMMALCNESANQAAMNMYIIDTVIYKQTRLLPLRLQKEYQRQLTKMKRYRSGLAQQPQQQQHDVSVLEKLIPSSIPEEEHTDTVESESECPAESVDPDWEAETREEVSIPSIISEAEEFVTGKKLKQKEDLNIVLPDPRSIRDAHRVASAFLEGEIGKEIIAKGQAYLMPDGTSRAKIGKMGGCLVHIDRKMRMMKMQKLGKDTRQNWADAIIFNLERLSTASEISVKEIYECVRAIVSDAASVNKGLAIEISSRLGLEWIPGQLYCCIHTVLGFQDGMVSIWLRYQSKIGKDKLYPTITGFELDMEDKCLVKQILECFLRLTADRWQARAWNRYEAYTQYAKDNGMLNVGQELHGNRFGDLEQCCAIGVYSLQLWLNFVNFRSDIRNDLAIFLRDTQHLNDICLLLWLGPALLGIHLTEPYLALMLEKQTSHLDLLKVLPQLYTELLRCEISPAQILKPAFPSLGTFWIDPLSPVAPYKKEIGMAISDAIKMCDKDILGDYLKELCKEMAVILKRQRGNAYKFGDVVDSPELVTSVLSEEELESAPIHSRDMENVFGLQDSILTRFGPQVFNKSTDDLIIRYSQDLLPPPQVWCTSKTRKLARKLGEQQDAFNEKQAALLRDGVTQTDAEALAKDSQIQKYVQACRESHNGPLGSPEEVDELINQDHFKEDEKALRKALIKEIRYRKYSSISIKFNNPLFDQMKVDTATLISNLKLLLMKSDSGLAAKATMSDLEAVILKGGCEENEEVVVPTSSENSSIENPSSIGSTDENTSSEVSHWPLPKGTHIAANFTDGFYIGEVLSTNGDTARVSYMELHKVLTANADEHKRRFWKWPSPREIFSTDRSCILNLRPSLSLATPPSTKRMYIFACDNAEILEALANSVTEEF